MKLFPNQPINIFLYGRVVKKLPHNLLNPNTTPPTEKSYVLDKGKEIIILIDDFYTIDGEKIYRPQNVKHNFKTVDLYAFAKMELQKYYESGLKGFKAEALDLYTTYKERNGKRIIDALENN